MTSRLVIPFRAFYRADEKPAAFRDILRGCLAGGTAISAEIGAETVTLDLQSGANASAALRLGGRWCAPDFHAGPSHEVGMKLMLPLLFCASRIVLPYAHIYTIGRDHRSVADFFARNLFLAMGRNAPVSLEESGDGEASANAVGDFRRQYFYIVKATFSESIFQERSAADIFDLMLANSYLPVIPFKNPLLRRGGEALRNSVRAVGADRDVAALKLRLMDARKTILAHYGS
ncbi:MAG: hypothetical protein AB7V13_08655 [Pseudorhodoplanes sp.]|uniref:hypothetical protein n=1 Tax=Pseudorhodoplanes sp. TaxID=1934341 RepID=UPI003D0BB216